MKTKRIINAAVWLIIATTLATCVCLQWAAQGAEIKSLVLAVVFYTAFSALFGAMIDAKIRRTNK